MEKIEELNNKMFELLNRYHKTGGETNEIKTLIEQGADVDAIGGDNYATPLMYVCGSYDYDKLGNGNLELAKFLISKGADVDAKNLNGNTALTNSALIGNVEITKLLIDNGADVNARDRSNTTPLIATQIALGENQQNAVQVAKLLIDNGADVNIRDNSGKTALDYQKSKVDDRYKNEEMIKLLKDTSTNELFESIETCYLVGEESNYIMEHIKESIANGADINCVKNCKRKIEIENYNGGLDCYTEQLYGYNIESATPLILSIHSKCYDLGKLFIEQGADVNIKNKEGKTALDIVIENRQFGEESKKNENLKNLIISKGGKRGIEIKTKSEENIIENQQENIETDISENHIRRRI